MSLSRPSESSPTAAPPSTQPFPDPIPGIIPHGSLIQFVGPPKCGKTAFISSWMPRLRDGRTICGLPTHPPTFLGIVTTDHKWHLNQGVWFAKAGYPDIPHVSLRDDASVNWRSLRGNGTGARGLLEKALNQLAPLPGGLIVIDVAGPFVSTRLNDYNEVLAGIGVIGQLCDAYQITAILLGHMGKQKADPKDRYLRPHERILGSGAQIGFTDTTMYLLGPLDTGQPYHTFGWLPTHAPEGMFKLHQHSETGMFEPYTGQLEPTPEPEAGLLAAVALLPDPPGTCTSAEMVLIVMGTCSVSRSQAWERINDLLLSGLVYRPKRGHFGRRRLT